MKLQILDLQNKKIGELKLPIQFDEEIRLDLIHRDVITIQKNRRQPFGTSRRAGLRHSADLSRRRKKYRGSYGHGISRVPRKIMSRRGTRMNWVGAEAPGTVGGRAAHPPKVSKILSKKINKKERRKALRSALNATLNKELASKRGHKVPKNYPFILDNKVESLSKTKDFKNVLEKLGFKDELTRTSKTKIRPGKGKSRGRTYRHATGPLIVVSKNCNLSKLSIQGIEVVNVKNINTELLAPGTHPGRVTIFSEAAIKIMEKEKLFT
jgi:large subunit ribosomal protein L4e